MDLRKFLVFNRLYIAIALIALGIIFIITTKSGAYWTWILFLVAIVMIVAHFMIGPMSLIQKYIENGDIEGSKALLERVKKPEWLYKPVRSAYHMLQSQMGMVDGTEDLDKSEAHIRKSLESGLGQKDVEGGAYMQLGAIAMRKGNNKEAYQHLKKALELGLPNKDAEAGVYLQLSSLSIARKDYRGAKIYYTKCVACKPTDPQIKEQIAEYKKYISRIPG